MAQGRALLAKRRPILASNLFLLMVIPMILIAG
jgi:hypothetical protein